MALLRKSAVGTRGSFASPSGVDRVPINNQARQLGRLTRHSRVVDRSDTVPSALSHALTHVQIAIQDDHLVIHDPSPIAALYKGQ